MTPIKRRVLLVLAGLAVLVFGLALLARQTLTGLAVSTLLQLSGASEIKFTVTQASPWQVVVEDIGFQVRTQGFSARRVSIARPHWWSPTLGVVRVEGARVPVTIDGSDTNPIQWATYQNGQAKVAPAQMPMDELSIDGRLVVRAAALPEQELTVKLSARLADHNIWTGQLQADGPGLGVKGEGSYDPAKNELRFKLPAVDLELKPWQGFVRRVVPLPGGVWALEGKLTGSAEGRLAGKEFAATARVQLRAGRATNTERAVAIEDVEADLEFTDLDKLVTKPGTLRAREIKVGQLVLHGLEAEVALGGSNQIAVSRLTFQTLGGQVTTEPFKFYPSQRELEAVVLADGVDVEAVMALTQDLPARVRGRVDGRFPLRIDDSGLRLGTGWLQIKPGVYAEIQFNANGLLTRGASPSNPGYAVLKKVEAGLLKLKLSELRLDIRPPDAPPGRSATLHLVGEPVDPDVKAPVVLDLHVNGPLEKLLNLGLDSRVNFGSKP